MPKELLIISNAYLLGTYFILMGIALVAHYFPPKKINMLYGYRTRRSMRDEVSWAYANHLFPKLMLIDCQVKLAFGYAMLLAAGRFLPFGLMFSLLALPDLLMFVVIILLVERKLRRIQQRAL